MASIIDEEKNMALPTDTPIPQHPTLLMREKRMASSTKTNRKNTKWKEPLHSIRCQHMVLDSSTLR